MVLIENWMPPSREHWEWVVYMFQFFPILTLLQWSISWYGMGKTSTQSRFNIPGKIAWLTMEVPGFLIVLYIMYTLPNQLGLLGLPWENKAMGGLFVIHYLYRAILCPFLAPSLSPIHPIVWLFAVIFQAINGLSIGGYLGGHGPTSRAAWANFKPDYVSGGRMELGMMIWALGFLANIWHDDELREIRRAAKRNAEQRAGEKGDEKKGKGKGVDKVYMIPRNGGFEYILYPHYLCEWIEWAGFWIMGGSACVPARNFLLNEIATMLPRAVRGRQWYVERFGKEKVAGKKAIIPGIL